MLVRSALEDRGHGSPFVWATGIEDTFIATPSPRTGRTLDQYELTRHYDRLNEDLGLMSSLGVKTARYGIPWYRINPGPSRWDLSWADRPLERLLELGISPIVDLVHYGVPEWIHGSFLNRDFPTRMEEYAERIADRYRGRITAFTPLNEPRITAWYCGRLGWWPPFRSGWRGFVEVLLSACRGSVLASRAIRRVDARNLIVHVDAADFYSSPDPTLQGEVLRRQLIGFLALDLMGGRVRDDHPLRSWVIRHGATETGIDAFRDTPLTPDVIGLSAYPMFSNKSVERTRRGVRIRSAYETESLIQRVTSLYWRRYRLPLMLAETASRGTVERRIAWLRRSVDAVHEVRGQGIPVIGYTWWPMLSHVAWAYQRGNRPLASYIERTGLWDLSTDGTLDRRPTALIDEFRRIVSSGNNRVGPLRVPADG